MNGGAATAMVASDVSVASAALSRTPPGLICLMHHGLHKVCLQAQWVLQTCLRSQFTKQIGLTPNWILLKQLLL